VFERGAFRARRVFGESNVLFVGDLINAIQAASMSVLVNRTLLEEYVRGHPLFVRSLIPIEAGEEAPKVVRLASNVGLAAQVGPFAAVPGAIADLALEEMLACGASVCLVENGGEIAADSAKPLNVGIYAGDASVSGRVGFRLDGDDFPIGIATSSASVSHASSFGEADAAVAVAGNAALADASATAICNAVTGDDIEASVQAGLETAEQIPQLRGALVARGRYVGSVGSLPGLLRLAGEPREMFMASLQDIAPQDAVIL
jgi:ApbE superfamily uncharacterized protein (UPF0280 family)